MVTKKLAISFNLTSLLTLASLFDQVELVLVAIIILATLAAVENLRW